MRGSATRARTLASQSTERRRDGFEALRGYEVEGGLNEPIVLLGVVLAALLTRLRVCSSRERVEGHERGMLRLFGSVGGGVRFIACAAALSTSGASVELRSQVTKTARSVLGATSSPWWRLKRRRTQPDHADDSSGRSGCAVGGWKRYGDSTGAASSSTAQYSLRMGVSADGSDDAKGQ